MRDAALNAARLRAAGPLWPWISRLLWAPGADLHPSRRAALLPGWPEQDGLPPAVLARLSRHLLETPDQPAWDHAEPAFRVALLPQDVLAHLALRMGLALGGAVPRPLAAEHRQFLHERAALYWRAPPLPQVATVAAEALGWQALRQVVAGQDAGVRRRFEWKTPAGTAMTLLPAAAPDLLMLAQRLMREGARPWSGWFTMTRR